MEAEDPDVNPLILIAWILSFTHLSWPLIQDLESKHVFPTL